MKYPNSINLNGSTWKPAWDQNPYGDFRLIEDNLSKPAQDQGDMKITWQEAANHFGTSAVSKAHRRAVRNLNNENFSDVIRDLASGRARIERKV